MVLCCRLVTSNMSCRKVQLLIYWERRSLYQQLKARFRGEWMRICREEFNICPQTANRYIACCKLVGAYPRIVICDLSFETIMYCKSDIIDEFEIDLDFSMHFRAPLREVSIRAAMNIDGECMPAVD